MAPRSGRPNASRSQAAKPGIGERVAKVLSSGSSLREVGRDQLDQEIAERDPAQALQAVVDRVEDRAVGGSRVAHRCLGVDQRLDAVGHAADERHLDEDQRLVGQGRMEEGEAAPIGREAALQVLQGAHPVDLLVAQELLQQRGRAVPVDRGEGQEARIEPAAEQVVEVGVDRRQLGMVRQLA